MTNIFQYHSFYVVKTLHLLHIFSKFDSLVSHVTPALFIIQNLSLLFLNTHNLYCHTLGFGCQENHVYMYKPHHLLLDQCILDLCTKQHPISGFSQNLILDCISQFPSIKIQTSSQKILQELPDLTIFDIIW